LARSDEIGTSVGSRTHLQGGAPEQWPSHSAAARALGMANRGAALEELLEWQHARYAAFGVALIHKLPTDWHVTRKVVGGWAAFPARKSLVDYVGLLLDGTGRHIAVEAKETAGDRWPFTSLPEHQREYLDAVWRAGGVAGIVLRWARHGVLWALPWAELAEWLRRGDRAVRYRADRDHAVRGADYLAVLVR